MKKIFLDNKIINSMIIVNTILTIILSFNIPYSHTLFIIDNVITGYFFLEITTKILYFKKDYFKNVLNIVDTILVIIACIPLILFCFVDTNLNYLLLFRIFRVFKFIRFGKFIPNYQMLFRDLNRAFKASIGLVGGGIIIMLIISTILTAVFHESYPEYFGNPFESAYSVFRMLTIEGWYEIPDAMSEGIPYISSVMIRGFFSIFVFVGGMLCMSFFTSLIVDEMVSDNNDELISKVDSLEKQMGELLEINKKLMEKLK